MRVLQRELQSSLGLEHQLLVDEVWVGAFVGVKQSLHLCGGERGVRVREACQRPARERSLRETHIRTTTTHNLTT